MTKLVRLLPLPWGVAVGFLLGCSDPPSPPAQAAAMIRIQPNGMGITCNHTSTGAGYNLPGNSPAVSHELSCDPTTAGCEPNKEVVVDGQSGTSVECTVKKTSSGYQVTATVDASGFMSFAINGVLTETGGKLDISDWDIGSGGVSMAGKQCDVTVKSIKSGAVLASYNCALFDEVNVPHDPACQATGAFLFEHCGS